VIIVLVHSGKKLPAHLIANLHFLSVAFPEKRILTVVDEFSTHTELNIEGFHSYLCKSGMDGYHSLSKKLMHNERFLDGFWYKTLKRFFMLHEFMKENPNLPVLHIESDVILLPNFPFQDFLTLKEDLAYPFVSDTHAAASILFVKNFEAIDYFMTFIREAPIDAHDTDMTLLARFSKVSENVFVLPTVVPSLESGVETTFYYNKHQPFKGIFDGATYGQFLFGLDPRTFFGFRRLFYSPPSHLVKPSELRYSVQTTTGQTILNVSDVSNNSFPLYNLHIHSKDLRVFKQNPKSLAFTKKRCQESTRNILCYEFDFHAFFFHLPRHFRSALYTLAKR
jgi:hypothetical protein